jgi:hypothetical protein
MQGPIALGQLQFMTAHALAAYTQFHFECSAASTMMLKGKFKVYGYSSNIALVFGTNQD